MGKSSRRRRRESERVLRDVGVVYFTGPDGIEVELDGPEAEFFRDLMRSNCPICAEGGEHFPE